MAQLSPLAVFGAPVSDHAVHVLLLIENSMPMVEHWPDLQHNILPGVLGAIRLANPRTDVQIFWETTGKLQKQHLPQRNQRHYFDLPEIPIVGLPQNKFTPLFIRQSVELFFSCSVPSSSVARHLFIVAMSNPVDEVLGSSELPGSSNADSVWDILAEGLIKKNVIVHVIAKPAVRMPRLFQLFRRVMRSQSRQEAIPWQPSDTLRCVCHLSGAPRSLSNQLFTLAQMNAQAGMTWPSIHTSQEEFVRYSQAPPEPALTSPHVTLSDYNQTERGELAQGPATDNDALSLVSRLQAIHGLAKKRPDRTRRTRPSFFRESSPRHERGTSYRERLRHLSALSTTAHGKLASSSNADGTMLKVNSISTFKRPVQIDSSIPTVSLPQSGYQLMQASPSSDSSSTSTPSPLWHQQNLMLSPNTGKRSNLIPNITSRSTLSLPSVSNVLGLGVFTPGLRQGEHRAISPMSPGAPSVQYPNQALTSTSAVYYSPISQNSYTNAYGQKLDFQDAYNYDQNFITTAPYTASANTVDFSDEDVVPASAPPDPNGEVPFIFDLEHEARNAIRSKIAVENLRNSSMYANLVATAQSNPTSSHAMPYPSPNIYYASTQLHTSYRAMSG